MTWKELNPVACGATTLFNILLQCVFFIGLHVFVHLTHLKLLQIGQTYLKFFVWLEKKNTPRIS